MPPRNDANGSNLPRTQGASVGASVYPTDSVQDVAEQLGLPPLKDSVASSLAADVEYRIRQVVQDASKCMRHAKRNQLRVSDIDRALRQRNIEPIFGFHPTTLGKASASGAYPTPVGSSYRRIQTQSGPVHLVTDEEIDLEKILDDGPKIALGQGVGWSAHWLAVEGVQPAVPQNPTSIAQLSSTAAVTAPAASSSTSMVQPSGASAFLAPTQASLGAKPGQPLAKPLIKHVLSRELQLYFERVTNAIIDPPTDADILNDTGMVADGHPTAQQPDQDGDVRMAANPEDSSAQPHARNSRFGTIAPTSSGNAVRDAALASLRGDAGLHQLVPYLVQWINEGIQTGLRDERMLELMLHTIDALLSSPYLGIEPYVHQLLPYVITVVVSASIGHTPSSPKALALRVHAAAILERIVRQYGAKYSYLKPRILRSLIKGLDAGCAAAARRASRESNLRRENGDHLPPGEASSWKAADDSGPREDASTKVGALIGLRSLGAGSLRALLVQDGRAADGGAGDCVLRRLGFWCAEVRHAPHRRAEVDTLVEEVKEAYADVFTTMRGKVSTTDADEALCNADVRRRIGEFWVELLASNPKAACGVLALFAELPEQQTAE